MDAVGVSHLRVCEAEGGEMSRLELGGESMGSQGEEEEDFSVFQGRSLEDRELEAR